MLTNQIKFLKYLRGTTFNIGKNNPKNSCSFSVGGVFVKDIILAKLAKELETLGYVKVREYKLGKEDYLEYTLTDIGRATARGKQQTLELEEARKLHDSDLEHTWGDLVIAKQVLEGRGKAAQQIRLVLARSYGRSGACTQSWWSVIPCLTDKNTIGILDIVHGCAWDTGVVADNGVYDLGLEEDVCGDANGIVGNCYIDNKLVQSKGVAVVDGNPITLNIPSGWKQIALPTWRGYHPNLPRYSEVPEELFKPNTWIRPTLVANHLMTCYGHPGTTDGIWLSDTIGINTAKFPWGVPPWIKGTSTSIFNVLVYMCKQWGRFYDLNETTAPRGSDEEELQFLLALSYELRIEFAARLKQIAKNQQNNQLKSALIEGVCAIQNGTIPTESTTRAICQIRNQHNGSINPTIPEISYWKSAKLALDKQLPHEAAVYLSMMGLAMG